MFRALITILVGLSLTLICQGHDTASWHTGPHLSLLGENNVGHEQHAPLVTNAIHTEHIDHVPGHVAGHEYSPLASLYSAPFNLQQDLALGNPTLNTSQGLESLSMQVAIIYAALCFVLRRYYFASGGQPLSGTETGFPPDHPPPRYFSLSPAA